MLIGVSVSNDPATFRDFKATAAGMNESLDVLRGWGGRKGPAHLRL